MAIIPINAADANAAVNKPKINAAEISLFKGDARRLKIQRGSAYRVSKVTWKSSRPKVAKVSKDGKVTAIKRGSATVTATVKAKPAKKAKAKTYRLKCKVKVEEEQKMSAYNFDDFKNVSITGAHTASSKEDEQSLLYQQARYCQAMVDADMETMWEIVSEDMVFTHMSGMTQSREEYFADIKAGRLNYFSIGIENPAIKINGDKGSITFTSVLNANAYGARGTYRMKGTHHYERRNGKWVAVNG